MKQIIASTTDAVTADINIAEDTFVGIAQSGLSGAEIVKLQIDLDGTWTDIIPAIELTATTNYIQVAGPATYRVAKPSTVSPVSVYKGA